MTVGLVLVSHSALIAEGLVELAGQMAGGVALVAAGGTDEGGIGTSFEKVSAAIAAADAGEGVVVLGDLGSAILTAETALDFLDDDQRTRVVIADAPLVEGAVEAAVAARIGGDLAAVVAAAESARGIPVEAGAAFAPAGAPDGAVDAPATPDGGVARTVTLVNEQGLHARPAAQFAAAAAGYDADVTANGVNAKSLLGIMALGLTRGATVELRASGPSAHAAVDGLATLIESGFGEE